MNKDILKIVERAQQNGLCQTDRITLLMDLEAAQLAFNLDCEKLLAADDFNFAHDIIGIQNNIDRAHTKLYDSVPHAAFDNCFVPRFARS